MNHLAKTDRGVMEGSGGGGRGSNAGSHLRIRDSFKIAVANPDEVKQAVKAEMRQRVVSALADQRLGPEGNTHSGKVEHGKIVGSVAHRDDLFERDFLLPGDLPQPLGLSGSVDNAARHLAGDHAAGDLQLVGVDVVDAEALLQVTGEKGKSAGQDRGLVAKDLESPDQLLRTLGERDPGDELQHTRLGQSLEQGHAAAKALLEFDLSAHGRLGNADHLIGNSGHLRQLVDDFTLNQRRVHIERKEAAVAAEDALALKGNVNREFGRGFEEIGAHPVLRGNLSADFQFDTGVRVSRMDGEREPPRQPLDAVDVERVIRNDGADA